MITQVELSFFKKHESLSVNFTEGINVIRAANEGGKSTILKAIEYALAGSRSLKKPLDEVVTWGHDVKKLKVFVRLVFEGVTYDIYRSKHGAEIKSNGDVIVTGQDTVSSFIFELLGTNSVNLSKLMVANQKSIRGAIEEGPKALSQLIEDLAGFSVFDDIFDAASKKLATGSTTALEERIVRLEQGVARLRETISDEPDETAHKAKLDAMGAEKERLIDQLESLHKEKQKLQNLKESTRQKLAQTKNAAKDVEIAKLKIDNAKWWIRELSIKANEGWDEKELTSAEKELGIALDQARAIEAYRIFNTIPSLSNKWHGDRANLDSYMETHQEVIKDYQEQLGAIKEELQSLRYKLFDTDICDKCGQRLPNAEMIKEANAKVSHQISALTSKRDNISDRLTDLEEALGVCRGIINRANEQALLISRVSQYVTLNEETYPPVVLWKGDPPKSDTADTADIPQLNERVSKLTAKWIEIRKARNQLELASTQLREAEDIYHQAQLAYADMEVVTDEDLATLESRELGILYSERELDNHFSTLNFNINRLISEFSNQVQIWVSSTDNLKTMIGILETCQKEAKEIKFNNGLMKKLRTIRPLIASKLWGSVLGTVSSMFSTLRNEPSIVTRSETQFFFNDHPIDDLSGSALDLMGLAIRCTLLKTFLPQCGFILLDEPMDGCSDERAGDMLGFLRSADFNQIILVSHEKLSESVADNLIYL